MGFRLIELRVVATFEKGVLEVVEGRSTGTNGRRVYDRLNDADVN